VSSAGAQRVSTPGSVQVTSVLQDCSQHRPLGVCVAAKQQPTTLPGVRERWKFIEPTLQKAPFIKIVPMLGSLGCPYTCSFCIDSVVPYQPLELDVIKEDLRPDRGRWVDTDLQRVGRKALQQKREIGALELVRALRAGLLAAGDDRAHRPGVVERGVERGELLLCTEQAEEPAPDLELRLRLIDVDLVQVIPGSRAAGSPS
jgi:hypothetical protein